MIQTSLPLPNIPFAVLYGKGLRNMEAEHGYDGAGRPLVQRVYRVILEATVTESIGANTDAAVICQLAKNMLRHWADFVGLPPSMKVLRVFQDSSHIKTDIVTDELINRFSIGQMLDAVIAYGYGSGEEFFEWLTNNWTDEDDAQTIIDQLHEALQRYHEPIEMPETPDYPSAPPVVEALQDAVFTALAPEPPEPTKTWRITLVQGPQLWERMHDRIRNYLPGRANDVWATVFLAAVRIPPEGIDLGYFYTEDPPLDVVARVLSSLCPVSHGGFSDEDVSTAYWFNLIRFTTEEV